MYGPISHHFQHDQENNEQNHVLGIELDKYVLLTFNNTHFKRSWFAGYDLEYRMIDFMGTWASLHLLGGALYGYGDSMPNLCGWSIGAAGAVEVGYGRVSVMASVLPFDGGVMVGVVRVYW